MSKDEIVCSELDNSICSNAQISKISNTGASDEGSFLNESSKNYVRQGDADIDVSESETCHHVDGEDNDIEEYEVEIMTGSYGEISLEQELLSAQQDALLEGKDSGKDADNKPAIEEEKLSSQEKFQHVVETKNVQCLKESKRPNSLVLAKSSNDSNGVRDEAEAALPEASEHSWKKIHKSQQTSDSQATSIDGSPSFSSEEFAIYSPRRQRTGSDSSGLTELQGTITLDGDMVSFVAEDLTEKIRMSSPVSRWTDSPSYPGSRSSTPSLYRQALQPNIPVIDPGAIADLERHAHKVATCVDVMLENLSGTLLSISSLTVDYMETYEQTVCKTCDAVDAGIKTAYQLVAKCEELGNSMKPLYKLSQEIKDVKKTLDQFENLVEHKS